MSNAGTNHSSGWVAGELIIAGPHVEFIFLLLSFSLINDMLWRLRSGMASWIQKRKKTKLAFYDNLNYRFILKLHFSFNPLIAALSILSQYKVPFYWFVINWDSWTRASGFHYILSPEIRAVFEGTKSTEAFLVILRLARGQLADHSLRCLPCSSGLC